MMTTQTSSKVSDTVFRRVVVCASVLLCLRGSWLVVVSVVNRRHYFNFDDFCSVCGVRILDLQPCLGGVKTPESTIFVDLRGGASSGFSTFGLVWGG
jgi:hypothetical protein